MYYELYVDSLFLVNFVMNLYLLLLVDRSTYRTATRRRLLLGAMAGAVCYLIPFCCSGPAWLKYGLCLGVGNVFMLWITFRVRSMEALFQLFLKLTLYSFLMGGALLFMLRRIPVLREIVPGIWGILGLGLAVYLLCSYWRERRAQTQNLCHVTLINGDNHIKISAIVDTGNSLTEPISGKSVSVLDEEVLHSLWKILPAYYRAIPFHSVGKSRGILRGYLVPELHIDMNGVVKVCKNVYVAAGSEVNSEGDETGIKMILNPLLLHEE